VLEFDPFWNKVQFATKKWVFETFENECVVCEEEREKGIVLYSCLAQINVHLLRRRTATTISFDAIVLGIPLFNGSC
jgi:hypothetical protein